MKLYIFVIFTLLITSCIKKRETIDYTDLAIVNEIRKNVFLKLKKETDLYPCGAGGQMMHEIQLLACSFNYYHEVDINQARELLLKAGNVFLKEINESEKIRPYLANYPFKPENIEIAIFVYNSDGSDQSLEKLRVITLWKGVLSYKIGILDSQDFRTQIYEETYEEAMAKINDLSRI